MLKDIFSTYIIFFNSFTENKISVTVYSKVSNLQNNPKVTVSYKSAKLVSKSNTIVFFFLILGLQVFRSQELFCNTYIPDKLKFSKNHTSEKYFFNIGLTG